MPAAWQESIKQGRTWSYARFLRKMATGKQWFARAMDLPTVLSTWGAHLPPERVHVVTVPPSGAARGREGMLWLRFCEAFGIDPEWAPLDSERANRSLGIPETELIRKLNKRLDPELRRDPTYDKLVRELLAQQRFSGGPATKPVRLPPEWYDWAEERAELWIDWLEGSGVHVVGDVDDLRPGKPPEDERWRDPGKVRSRLVLKAGLDALDAMTREAARRPDPDQQLTSMVRQSAERLRRSR
ncbi:MAG: hypothetical protein R2731_00465 [Nocardioides sp.]